MTRIFLNDRLILSVILLSSGVIFLLGFKSLSTNTFLQTFDHCLTIFFIAEVFVKFKYYGVKKYFNNRWNIFDFTIVLFSSVTILTLFMDIGDFTFLLTLRLARVVRFAKLLRFIPDIDHLLLGITRALKSSVLVIVCLILYTYILSIISCSIFGRVAPEYFENPLLSLYSTFKLFTIEGWYEMPDLIAERSTVLFGSFARIYFMGVIFTGGIIGLSLVNAVFVDEMTMDNNKDRSILHHRNYRQ